MRTDGTIKFKRALHFVSETLIGERVGLAETDDGVWSLYFSDRLLARFDERKKSLCP